MTTVPPSDHFQGKSIMEHLRVARTKGFSVSQEIHGRELSGYAAAFSDAAKDTAFSLLILWLICMSILPHQAIFSTLIFFSCGYFVWKTSRSALLGWERLERLHRLIEEERSEILHNREQEKEELTELYRAKGFSGKLLNDVIDILMADDNRLLEVMLDEEFGLSLETYEHPLKQCFGAAFGTLLSSLLCLSGFWMNSAFGLGIFAMLVIIASSLFIAIREKNALLPTIIWNLSIGIFVIGVVYFLQQAF